MSDKTASKRIIGVERMTSSRNGNPRYRLIFSDGSSAPTQPDASIAYGITNSEYQNVPVEVTFNGRGHVTYVKIKTVE